MCQPSSPAGSSHSGAGGWRGGLEGRWKGKGCKEEVSPCVPKSLTASLLVAAVTGTPAAAGRRNQFQAQQSWNCGRSKASWQKKNLSFAVTALGTSLLGFSLKLTPN